MTETKDTLLRLLELNRKDYHIQYYGYLSNHLPMVLVSLYEMGATSQRLQDYFTYYTARLETSVPSMQYINASNWKDYLGTRQFLKDYREFFKVEKDRIGSWKDILHEYLPTLMQGVIGGAFHPILYLGYGVEILGLDNGELLLDGLAYMAYNYTLLGNKAISFKSTTKCVLDIFQDISSNHLKRPEFDDHRIKFPTKLELFNSLEGDTLNSFDTLDLETKNVGRVMDEIGNVMIGLYSTTLDFFVLHGVTSCYAMKLVLNMMDAIDKPFLVRCYLRALMTTYIIQGQPSLEFADANAYSKQLVNKTWEQFLFTAMGNNDEHVIKFVWTCWKENKDHPHPLYLLCAAKKMELVTPQHEEVIWPWAVAGAAILGGLLKYRADHKYD